LIKASVAFTLIRDHMSIPESLRKFIDPVLVGTACAALVLLVGHYAVGLQSSRVEAYRKVELVSLGSLLQARLNEKLNRELYLTSGLKSYLIVRRGNLRPAEVQAILARLYADTRHIRVFGIAVGYRLTYIYPLKGNEQALGLNYRDLPAQWPAVKRVIDGGMPALLGPVDLLQGGSGLIYRVPVVVDGKYWGLLSTVIDVDPLLMDVFEVAHFVGVDAALRGRDGLGIRGEAFYGDSSLFSKPDVEQFVIKVPGGSWAMALRAKSAPSENYVSEILSAFIWALAAFVGWSAYMLRLQRARLTRLALSDALTGLPNRTQVEVRLRHAIAAGRRDASAVCIILFFDLDGFKAINDRYGHRAGDAVLRGVAERVLGTVREVDSVGRWGGDEFVALFENGAQEKIPDLVARVRNAVEVPLKHAGHSLKVGASIGTATAPEDGNSVAELVRIADKRMYEDKQARMLESRSRRPEDT